jgi:hypothetical protein
MGRSRAMAERSVSQFSLVSKAKFFIGSATELCLGLQAETHFRPQTDANAGSMWSAWVATL